MLVLIIIGLLGLIFGLSLILYFTSKDIIGDDVNISNSTEDYDAVIIGHSQFEKIPLSKERQVVIIERQITEIERAIEQTKADRGERYTIKQMEKTKKSLSTRLEKLNDDTRKDNVVTFEQLDEVLDDDEQVVDTYSVSLDESSVNEVLSEQLYELRLKQSQYFD